MIRKTGLLLAVILSFMCFSAAYGQVYAGVEKVDFIFAEAGELAQNTAGYIGKHVRTSFVLREEEGVYLGECDNVRSFGIDVEEDVSLEDIVSGSVIAVIARVEDFPDPEGVVRLTVCRVLSPVDESGAACGQVDYICNTNTGKFHLPDCSSVGDMKEKNKAFYSGPGETLIESGYDPCKRCNP